MFDLQTVTVLLPDGTTAQPTAGSIKLDAGWSPYIQARVTVPLPASLSAYDPRSLTLPRVKITAVQDFTDSDLVSAFTTQFGAGTVAALTTAYGSGTVASITAVRNRPWSPNEDRRQIRRIFDLGLRTRTRNQDGTLELELESDESLLQDFAAIRQGFASETQWLGPVELRALVLWVLGKVFTNPKIGPMNYDFDLSPYAVTVGSLFGIWWPAGVSAWDFLQNFLEMSSMRLWADENNVWQLAPDPQDTGQTLQVVAGDNLTRFTDTITRNGDWANAVQVIFRWTIPSGTVKTVSIQSYETPATRMVTITRDLGMQDTNFTPPVQTAAYLFDRRRAAGRDIPVSAITDWSATPGAVLITVLPGTGTPTGRLRSVEFDLDSAEMALINRSI